jgi:hypothetical protein
LLVLVMLVGAGVAQAKKKPRTPTGPPADLPGHVNYLARQLLGVPLDESDPITGQIQGLVVDHFQEWLANQALKGEVRDVPVRREVESIFTQLHYPLYAWPAVFARPWKGLTLVAVGYTLGWSDYDRVNVIALFELQKGQPHLAALAHFSPHNDLHYEFMAGPPSGDFWFVAYGTRLGKSQRRLTAVLYAFDGQNLKSLWEIHDAYDGRIDVGRNWVTLRYLREDEYIRATTERHTPPRYEAVYMATPQGLELQSQREIPF